MLPASASPIEIEPFFLEGEQGALFCLYLHPAASKDKHSERAGILYLPPFAEEMHKSRRMAALQARAFAAAGHAVLQLDLSGCGDSTGDFSQASWQQWLRDARLAYDWLAAHSNGAVQLWGLRSGASLAVELASRLPAPTRLLLWQPMLNGETLLKQFLRLKTTSEMLSQGAAQNSTETLRTRLEAGETLEIGGYGLSATLAKELAARRLSDFTPAAPVRWLEVGASEQLAPASQRVIEQWRAAGVTVEAHSIAGDPFWQTAEISVCPRLLAMSLP